MTAGAGSGRTKIVQGRGASENPKEAPESISKSSLKKFQWRRKRREAVRGKSGTSGRQLERLSDALRQRPRFQWREVPAGRRVREGRSSGSRAKLALAASASP